MPDSAAGYPFTAAASGSGKLPPAELAQSPAITVTPCADGTGTMVVAPDTAMAAQTTQLAFTYTAAGCGIEQGGFLTLTVPAGWPTPVTATGEPGSTTVAGAGTPAISGMRITVGFGSALPAGSPITITYLAQAPAATGSYQFSAAEKSARAGQLTALAASPSVADIPAAGTTPSISSTPAGGTGSVIVHPASVIAGRAATLTFSYRAAPHVALRPATEVTVVIPADFERPSRAVSGAALTTAPSVTVIAAARGRGLPSGSLIIAVIGLAAAAGAAIWIRGRRRRLSGAPATAGSPRRRRTGTCAGRQRSHHRNRPDAHRAHRTTCRRSDHESQENRVVNAVPTPPLTALALLAGPSRIRAGEAAQSLLAVQIADGLAGRLGELPDVTRAAAVREVAAAAADVLDVTLAGVIISGWREYHDLTSAASRTLAAQGSTELVQLAAHCVTATQRPAISVLFDGKRVATVHLDLDLQFDISGLVAGVSGGRLTAVHSGRCDVTATLIIEDTEVATRHAELDLPGLIHLSPGIRLLADREYPVSQSAPADPGAGPALAGGTGPDPDGERGAGTDQPGAPADAGAQRAGRVREDTVRLPRVPRPRESGGQGPAAPPGD
ncbi:MAG: hypothetical protein ACLP7J_30135 [Streptosporangiaceae bacterium]